MRFRYIFPISLAAASFIFLCASYFTGPLGRYRYDKLLKQEAAMVANLADLEAKQVLLADRKNNLLTSEDALILEARKVGYFRRGEKLIVIAGLSQAEEEPDVGKILRSGETPPPPVAIAYVLASLTFITVCLLLLLFTGIQGARFRRAR